MRKPGSWLAAMRAETWSTMAATASPCSRASKVARRLDRDHGGGGTSVSCHWSTCMCPAVPKTHATGCPAG